MKTIIAGMRDFHDYGVVCEAVQASGFTITEVVSGAAPGVEALGERWAVKNKVPVKHFPADRKKHGKAAWTKAHKEMALYAEALIAVWNGESKGTGSMIRYARAKGLKVYVRMVEPEERLD